MIENFLFKIENLFWTKVVDSFVFWFNLDSMTSERDPPQKIPLTCASTINQIVTRFNWFCKQKHTHQEELFWRRSFCDVIEYHYTSRIKILNESTTLLIHYIFKTSNHCCKVAHFIWPKIRILNFTFESVTKF